MSNTAARFENFLNNQFTDDAVEEREIATTIVLGVEQKTTRFFIRVGFAGCNTRANNSNGYPTRAKAEAVCLDYQGR